MPRTNNNNNSNSNNVLLASIIEHQLDAENMSWDNVKKLTVITDADETIVLDENDLDTKSEKIKKLYRDLGQDVPTTKILLIKDLLTFAYVDSQ